MIGQQNGAMSDPTDENAGQTKNAAGAFAPAAFPVDEESRR